MHPSDLAPALIALDAEVVIASPGGERTMELDSFFTLPSEGSILRENVLLSDEVVTHIRVPAQPPGAVSTYLKFRERESFDFALGAVAFSLVVESGVIQRARLCLGAVAPIPWRCSLAEEWLVGKTASLKTFKTAGERALFGAKPLAKNQYKVPLSQGLIVKAGQALTDASQENK